MPTIVIRSSGPGPRSLAAASLLPCPPPCTYAFDSNEPLPPQHASSLHGTASSPITITSLRRRAVLSGASSSPTATTGLLTLSNSSHVVIRDLDLHDAPPCNGSNVAYDPHGVWHPQWGLCGAGIAVLRSSHVTVEKVAVRDVWSWGWAAVGGSYLTVRDSTFSNLQLCNHGGQGLCMRALWNESSSNSSSVMERLRLKPRGWGQGLATGVDGSHLASHVSIINNTITRSWGEAIDVLCAEHAIIAHNTIKDAWSSGIYVDNSRHVLVSSNLVRFDDRAFFRPNDDEGDTSLLQAPWQQ